MEKKLPLEIERALIRALVARTFEDKKVDALTEYVFEVMDYRKLTFSQIIDELQDVDVCEVCGEGTDKSFMVDTEGTVNGGYGNVCDYCYGNGR
jgi:hypothetical protein